MITTAPEQAAADLAAELANLRASLLRAEARLSPLRIELHRRQAIPEPAPAPPEVACEPPPAVDTSGLDALIAHQRAEISLLRRQLAMLTSSAAWKMSWPLRRLLRDHPTLARLGRRTLTAAWWGLTLQGPQRLRARSAAQEAARQALLQAAIPIAEPAPAPEPEPEMEPEPEAAPLVLPTSRSPLVSVIIPSYGQVPVTLRCLEAIAASETETPFEVIVAEDGSGDPDMAQLERVRGLRLLCRVENLGFLRNCNDAALLARGRYLLFLNNDTEPLPGFLDAMVRLAEALPDVGLVGSKLLFPDGRLQEAGGIIWNDGTGWNYGRGDDPDVPRYSTVRETDYVSGASILLRRDLFEQLQGFDPVFAPAYYEDVDLAFRVRARGLRVVYQPASVVIHHEGLSHGTDITSGIKAGQEVNRHRLLARWPRMLATEHVASGTDVMRAAEHAAGRPTMLVIDHYVPEPDRDAGSRSIMAILSALKSAGWLVKFWPQNRVCNDYTVLLETMGIEVMDQRLPIGFQTWIAQNGAELDHVLVLRPTVAIEFLSDLLCHTRSRLSFYGVDIHHVRMRRQAALTHDVCLAAEAEEMARLERRLWGLFDRIIYPSEEEAALVRVTVPTATAHSIVGFSHDRFRARPEAPAAPVILFVAGFAHPPNIDAAQWLVAEILPLVQAHVPGARLVLAGSHPTEAVRALAKMGTIVVTGSLSDAELDAQYRAARVAIVPLRVGAGVKGKVVEALSQGLPLATTPIGAEGLPGLDQVVTVTDVPEQLATTLARLLCDDRAWTIQSLRQVAYAEQHFSRSAFAASLFAALA